MSTAPETANASLSLNAVCRLPASSPQTKLLVEEDGSDVATRLWDDADVILASRLRSQRSSPQ